MEAEETKTSESSKKSTSPKLSLTHYTTTNKFPQWTYFHLIIFSTTDHKSSHDVIAARQNLTKALTKSWGLLGVSIPVDILKIDDSQLWIRVPRDNAKLFHEAVGAWTGKEWRYVVNERKDWLVECGGDGQDLFG